MKYYLVKFLIFILNQFQVVHSGKALEKAKASAALGVTISPVAILLEQITNWALSVFLFFSILGIALFADLVIGIWVHIRYFKDFDPAIMLEKFLQKSFLTYMGLLLFGLFDILFNHYGYMMGNYVKLAISICIMLYPVLSVLGNMSVMTGGKFPPIEWIRFLENYQKNIKLNELYKKDENRNSSKD